MVDYAQVKNENIRQYSFLKELYADPYFPDQAVAKVDTVLRDLCLEIEKEQPQSLEDLYELTNAATETINDLQNDFWEADSEIETGAREAICEAFELIAKAYSFDDADSEELTSAREW